MRRLSDTPFLWWVSACSDQDCACRSVQFSMVPSPWHRAVCAMAGRLAYRLSNFRLPSWVHARPTRWHTQLTSPAIPLTNSDTKPTSPDIQLTTPDIQLRIPDPQLATPAMTELMAIRPGSNIALIPSEPRWPNFGATWPFPSPLEHFCSRGVRKVGIPYTNLPACVLRIWQYRYSCCTRSRVACCPFTY